MKSAWPILISVGILFGFSRVWAQSESDWLVAVESAETPYAALDLDPGLSEEAVRVRVRELEIHLGQEWARLRDQDTTLKQRYENAAKRVRQFERIYTRLSATEELGMTLTLSEEGRASVQLAFHRRTELTREQRRRVEIAYQVPGLGHFRVRFGYVNQFAAGRAARHVRIGGQQLDLFPSGSKGFILEFQSDDEQMKKRNLELRDRAQAARQRGDLSQALDLMSQIQSLSPEQNDRVFRIQMKLMDELSRRLDLSSTENLALGPDGLLRTALKCRQVLGP